MWVGEIDVHDDGQFERFWATSKEANAFERPFAAFWSLQAAKVAHTMADNPMEQHALAAFDDDGTLVGAMQVTMPRLDNTHLAYGEPLVPPAFRRRGIGSALLERALAFASERGRTTFLCEVHRPVDGAGPGDAPGVHLAEKFGFTTASLELHRILDLPQPADRLAELAGDAAPHHVDYELVPIGSHVPDELVDGYCALQEAFNAEAPLGDLDLEPEAWDLDRVRKAEARFEAQGRKERKVAAVAPDGTMVALTELMTTVQQPELAWQGGTLVLPGHRGHRLGLAVKVANLQAFQQEFPAARIIHSWNAEENDAMVAINDRLGFRAVEYTAEMQRKV